MRLIVHRSKAEQQSSREAKGKKKNSVSNTQMPGGYTTQVLAQLRLEA